MAGVLWLIRPAPLFVMFLLWKLWLQFSPNSATLNASISLDGVASHHGVVPRKYTCTGCARIRRVTIHLASAHGLGALDTFYSLRSYKT